MLFLLAFQYDLFSRVIQDINHHSMSEPAVPYNTWVPYWQQWEQLCHWACRGLQVDSQRYADVREALTSALWCRRSRGKSTLMLYQHDEEECCAIFGHESFGIMPVVGFTKVHLLKYCTKVQFWGIEYFNDMLLYCFTSLQANIVLFYFTTFIW